MSDPLNPNAWVPGPHECTLFSKGECAGCMPPTRARHLAEANAPVADICDALVAAGSTPLEVLEAFTRELEARPDWSIEEFLTWTERAAEQLAQAEVWFRRKSLQ